MVKAVDVFNMTSGLESKRILSSVIVASENQELTFRPSEENRELLSDLGISVSLEKDILDILWTSGFTSKAKVDQGLITFNKSVREAAQKFLEEKGGPSEQKLNVFLFADKYVEPTSEKKLSRLRLVAYENNPFTVVNLAAISEQTAKRYDIPEDMAQAMNDSLDDMIRARTQVLDCDVIAFGVSPEEMKKVADKNPSFVINMAMSNIPCDAEEIPNRNNQIKSSLNSIKETFEAVKQESRGIAARPIAPGGPS